MDRAMDLIQNLINFPQGCDWLKVLDKTGKLGQDVFPKLLEEHCPTRFGHFGGEPNTLYMCIKSGSTPTRWRDYHAHLIAAEWAASTPDDVLREWNEGALPPYEPEHKVAHFTRLKFLPSSPSKGKKIGRILKAFQRQYSDYRSLRVEEHSMLELYFGSETEAASCSDRFNDKIFLDATIETSFAYLPDVDEVHSYISTLGPGPRLANLKSWEYSSHTLRTARSWATTEVGQQFMHSTTQPPTVRTNPGLPSLYPFRSIGSGSVSTLRAPLKSGGSRALRKAAAAPYQVPKAGLQKAASLPQPHPKQGGDPSSAIEISDDESDVSNHQLPALRITAVPLGLKRSFHEEMEYLRDVHQHLIVYSDEDVRHTEWNNNDRSFVIVFATSCAQAAAHAHLKQTSFGLFNPHIRPGIAACQYTLQEESSEDEDDDEPPRKQGVIQKKGPSKSSKRQPVMEDPRHVYTAEDAIHAQQVLKRRLNPWAAKPLEDVVPLLDPAPAFAQDKPYCTPDIIRDNIHSWHTRAHRPIPLESVSKPVLEALPAGDYGMQVLEEVRSGQGNPVSFIRAISNGQCVAADDPCLYLLMVRVVLGSAMDAVERISNVSGAERARIVDEVTRLVQKLRVNHPEDYAFYLPYVGYTKCLEERACMDMIRITFNGPPQGDRRPPLTVMMDVGARVTSLADEGCVSFKHGVPTIHAAAEILEAGRLPSVIRIPLLSLKGQPSVVWRYSESVAIGIFSPLQLNVEAGGEEHWVLNDFLKQHFPSCLGNAEEVLSELLVISDATGVRGASLADCRTGRIIYNGLSDLLCSPDPLLRNINMHSLIGYPSNDPDVTPEEIDDVKTTITKHDVFWVIMGSTVALKNACQHLFDVKIKPKDILYFKLYPGSFQGTDIIFMGIPHTGFTNYVGRALVWVMEAFMHSLAVAALVSSTIKQVKHDRRGSAVSTTSVASETLTRLAKSEVMKELSRRLGNAGVRSAWKGDVAVAIAALMTETMSFEDALADAWSGKHNPLIRSFLMPTPSHPRLDEIIRIPAIVGKKETRPGKNPESGVCFSALIPSTNDNPPDIREMRLDACWRQEEHETGHLFIDETTLDLIFLTTEGRILLDKQQQPFRVKRWDWMTSVSLGSVYLILEKQCQYMGVWTDLREWERREIDGRHPRHDKTVYSISKMSNNVHTLIDTEIDAGIERGDITLFRLGSAKYTIRFWEESARGFHRTMHCVKMPWLSLDLRGATHFALSYDFANSLWKFRLYSVTDTNRYLPLLIGDHSRTFHSTFNAGSAVVKLGEATELFKEQQKAYRKAHPTALAQYVASK